MAPRKFDRYMIVLGAARNRKFARLTDSELRAHFFGVLAVAAQSPRRGYLLVSTSMEAGAHEVAAEAGVSLRIATSAVEKLKQVGVLERDDEAGAWFVHDWWDHNPEPERVDPTNADRQRRYRQRNVTNNVSNAVSNGESNGESNASNASPSPSPSPPPHPLLNPILIPLKGEGGSARKRASHHVDQSKRPEGFPEHLANAGKEALQILHRVWKLRGGVEPQPRGVGLAIMRDEAADHIAVARELEHYMTAGKGCHIACGDIAQRYGDRVASAGTKQQLLASSNGHHKGSPSDTWRALGLPTLDQTQTQDSAVVDATCEEDTE